MVNPIKITHCIFDMDGLMLDTETIYEKVYDEIANEYGKSYTNEVKLKILGRPEIDGANIFVQELGIPLTGKEFLSKFKPIALERLQNPEFLPGVVKLIKHLSKHNIPMSIATSSAEDVATVKLKNHKEIFDLFYHMVCGSSDPEVKNGKPAPDIYLICASRFPDNPKPENVLVFEDAPNGVEGAITAGMSCVMVPDEEIQNNLSNLLKKQPTLIINSLEDFKPELFNIPKYD
ncbi:pseudouridine-5'-phosphatase-like [Onthophagus taurus]|uniref:pseudouridine-5'-phosphatase-like n=1 Tax=Onthophagus taurus TaxID=166361 RepID=UPI0039BE5268